MWPLKRQYTSYWFLIIHLPTGDFTIFLQYSIEHFLYCRAVTKGHRPGIFPSYYYMAMAPSYFNFIGNKRIIESKEFPSSSIPHRSTNCMYLVTWNLSDVQPWFSSHDLTSRFRSMRNSVSCYFSFRKYMKIPDLIICCPKNAAWEENVLYLPHFYNLLNYRTTCKFPLAVRALKWSTSTRLCYVERLGSERHQFLDACVGLTWTALRKVVQEIPLILWSIMCQLN